MKTITISRHDDRVYLSDHHLTRCFNTYSALRKNDKHSRGE